MSITRGLRSFDARPVSLHLQPGVRIKRRQVVEVDLWLILSSGSSKLILLTLSSANIRFAYLFGPRIRPSTVSPVLKPKLPR